MDALGLAELLVFKCEDERGDEWTIVPPEDVPSAIKDNPSMIEYMVEGLTSQLPGESTIYAAIKIGSPTPTTIGSAIKVANEVMH